MTEENGRDAGKSIEEKIVDRLLKTRTTVSTAESCTGGMIASTLINVAGVSAAYCEGYVTYANSAKHKLLGVREETLKEYGAVSEQTASEMALGCAKAAESDYAIVSTGIAGPEGGTPEKPVGLVYIGCFARGEIFVEKCHFSGSRMEIRQAATREALEFLYGHMR